MCCITQYICCSDWYLGLKLLQTHSPFFSSTSTSPTSPFCRLLLQVYLYLLDMSCVTPTRIVLELVAGNSVCQHDLNQFSATDSLQLLSL